MVEDFSFTKVASAITITDLIINARNELVAARDRCDRLSERVWESAVNRLLEMYSEDQIDD